MTLIISWIGVDDKKEGKRTSSIYIASDSRYSWGISEKYDYGIKVFGSSRSPEIFGFCGDVLIPTIILGQLIPQIDAGIIFNNEDKGVEKNAKIFEFISTSLKKYPKEKSTGSFTILHGTRVGEEFSCFKTSYYEESGLRNEEIDLPKFSTKICSEGSGSGEFNDNFQKWQNEKHNNYRTSRGVFHCLSETLREINDPLTGGLPQIVGLYRNRNSRLFGIVMNNKKYIYGKESSEDINSDRIEWRNESFERIDPKTLKILSGAQRQPL